MAESYIIILLLRLAMAGHELCVPVNVVAGKLLKNMIGLSKKIIHRLAAGKAGLTAPISLCKRGFAV